MTIELKENQVVRTDWKPSPQTSEPVVVELGTTWVAPGEGSTWRELFSALGSPGRYDYPLPFGKHGKDRSNLLLTGSPLQPYDRQRWESGNVE